MNFAWRARMKFARELDSWRRLFKVHQINGPFTGTRAFLAIIIICGAIGMLPVARAWSAPVRSAVQLSANSHGPLAQDDSDEEDDKDVPTSQVDKYISVYESMQKDHNLTVDQATSKEGLTVAQFRALENKIEADDTLRERVRKALRHAANPNEKDTSDE